MVYPALTCLEEIGYADVQAEGSKKRYLVTDAGRERLAANREAAYAMLERLAHIAQKMSRMRRAFAEEGEESSEHGFSPKLVQTRRALKAVFSDARDAHAEEQRRIAQILEQAIADIRGGGKR